MPNLAKARLLDEIRQRFGDLQKLPNSQSLFSLGADAARIYVRYSRVHEHGRTFFGLRDVDLRQLEGHNSFICFLLDDGSPPVMVPFSDFEEIFRTAPAAQDGQHKVQLCNDRVGRELYIPRKGRFNVEGFIGFDPLQQGIASAKLRPNLECSHCQVQTLLAAIGSMKKYDVFIPNSDRGQLDWSLTPAFSLRDRIPVEYDSIAGIICEIDVVWFSAGRNSIEALFEVEHTTSISSGLLRFNDALLTDSKISRFSIVSNEARRSLFARQLFRPTFRKSGLSEITSFLDYSNVVEWHRRISQAAPQASQAIRRNQ